MNRMRSLLADLPALAIVPFVDNSKVDTSFNDELHSLI